MDLEHKVYGLQELEQTSNFVSTLPYLSVAYFFYFCFKHAVSEFNIRIYDRLFLTRENFNYF